MSSFRFGIWAGRPPYGRTGGAITRNTTAIVYVVDSCDKERIPSKEELQGILEEDELRNCIIMIFANKQDLPEAATEVEITEGLGLRQSRTGSGPYSRRPRSRERVVGGDGVAQPAAEGSRGQVLVLEHVRLLTGPVRSNIRRGIA